MHIIFFNTKGGVSKSTLCECSANELARLGYQVHVDNTDQQEHVTLIDNDAADYFLYDTAGAFTAANVELLKAAANAEALIIIPMNTGANDLKELDFILDRLDEFGVKSKSKVVLTKVRINSALARSRRELIQSRGIEVAKWSMPMLDDFADNRQSTRTRKEISAFLHEVVL